jgi:hypothetical protein
MMWGRRSDASPSLEMEAQLVDDEHVDAEQPLLETRELTGIAGFQQLAHEVGGASEKHAAFLLRGFRAKDVEDQCEARDWASADRFHCRTCTPSAGD